MRDTSLLQSNPEAVAIDWARAIGFKQYVGEIA